MVRFRMRVKKAIDWHGSVLEAGRMLRVSLDAIPQLRSKYGDDVEFVEFPSMAPLELEAATWESNETANDPDETASDPDDTASDPNETASDPNETASGTDIT